MLDARSNRVWLIRSSNNLFVIISDSVIDVVSIRSFRNMAMYTYIYNNLDIFGPAQNSLKTDLPPEPSTFSTNKSD